MVVKIATCLLSLPAWLVAAQTIASQAYTPVAENCPDGFELVRMAGPPGSQALSTSEAAYVQARRSQVIPEAWKAYLANVEATDTELPSYVSSILNGSCQETPNLGIAMSGGSYRAAIFGAGVLNVFDGRNASSNSAGLGGVLQAATYLSGLSGGAWLVVSLAQANFPQFQELVFGYPDSTVANNTWGGWNADFNVFLPSTNATINAAYSAALTREFEGKFAAGYPVTLVDFWARALARHFVNGTSPSNFFDESYTHGAGILWSQVSETEAFKSYNIPFPIVVADLLEPGQNNTNTLPGQYTPISNPIIEFNVYETGTYDPMLAAFVPTKYLGTTNNSICVTNYDQLAFLAGSSSDVFHEFNVTNILNFILGREISILEKFLPEPGVELDAAALPNPFYGVAPGTFVASNQKFLSFIDGGDDGELIPLQPLLVKAREVDTLLVIDATADVNNFTFGSSLIATQDRIALLSPAYSFPPVPTSLEDFMAKNLTTRPTFFGCELDGDTPFVIYIANGGPPPGHPPITNTSSSQIAYTSSEIQAMLDEANIVATQGFPQDASMTTDPEWPGCLACAIVDRARSRAGIERTGKCLDCMARYCYQA